MSKIRTHYDNLKIARNAPDSLIRAAYKVLLQQHHPDKVEGSKQQDALRITQLIRESYDVLSDPIKRAEHDKWIKEQEYGKSNENQYYQKQENHDSTNVPINIENNTGCFWIIGLVVFCLWIFFGNDESPTSEIVSAQSPDVLSPQLPKTDIERLDSAKELLKQKQFEDAVAIYRYLAESDNSAVRIEAQNELGVMYSQGTGVAQNYPIALLWFQKSANQQYAGAEYNLGWLYEKGLGVEKDFATALFWYQKAKDHEYSTEHSKKALIHLGDDLNSLRVKFLNELHKDIHTKIWFEQSFKNGEDNYHVIFTKTSENGLFNSCHACGVDIGAATYKKENDWWRLLVKQQKIGEMGELGDVDNITRADTLDLSQNKTLFLMRTSYMGMGEGQVNDELFLFSENKWRNLGSIIVKEDNIASVGCVEQLSCISYTGKLSVIPSEKEYPDLLLTTKIYFDIDEHSDMPDAKDKIIKPSNRIYVFNGKEYEEKKTQKIKQSKTKN